MKTTFFVVTAAVLLVAPMAAQAQGIVRGAEYGAREGNRAAGPIGGIVGGAVGLGLGGAAGVLGLDYRPQGRAGRNYYRGRDGKYYRRG